MQQDYLASENNTCLGVESCTYCGRACSENSSYADGLFDLETDPREEHNVVDLYPEVIFFCGFRGPPTRNVTAVYFCVSDNVSCHQKMSRRPHVHPSTDGKFPLRYLDGRYGRQITRMWQHSALHP